MDDIDFSELKESSVGRPKEYKIDRIDLKPYLVNSKFERRLNPFFKVWDEIVTAKAKRAGKIKYTSNMEAFYGEVLEKFSILSKENKKVVLTAFKPIKVLYDLTNLSKPYVFEKKEDNDYFIHEVINTNL